MCEHQHYVTACVCMDENCSLKGQACCREGAKSNWSSEGISHLTQQCDPAEIACDKLNEAHARGDLIIDLCEDVQFEFRIVETKICDFCRESCMSKSVLY